MFLPHYIYQYFTRIPFTFSSSKGLKSMASSTSFPSPAESEAAEALLLLSKQQPFLWASTKKRSIRYRSESDSKITAKEETDDKIVLQTESPSTPLSLNCTSDDPPPRSTSAKRQNEFLNEQREKVTALVQDNMSFKKDLSEMRRQFFILRERNALLKRIKESSVLNGANVQSRSEIPSTSDTAALESARQISIIMAVERRLRWREECAAARKRRMDSMREKFGETRRRSR